MFYANSFEASSFLFGEKRRRYHSCGLSQEIGDGMGWLHGCTTIVLSCRLGFACAAVQPAHCRRERLRENMEIRVSLVDAVIALAAIGGDKREALRGNMLKHVDLRVR